LLAKFFTHIAIPSSGPRLFPASYHSIIPRLFSPIKKWGGASLGVWLVRLHSLEEQGCCYGISQTLS